MECNHFIYVYNIFISIIIIIYVNQQKGNAMINQLRPQPPKLKMKASRIKDLDEEIIFSPEFEEEYEIGDPDLDMAIYTALVSRLVDEIANKQDLSMDDEEALEDKVLAIISSIAAQQSNVNSQVVVKKTVSNVQQTNKSNNNTKVFSLSKLSKGLKNKPLMKTGLATSLLFQSSMSNSYRSAFKKSMKPKLDKQMNAEKAYKLKKDKLRNYRERLNKEEEREELKLQQEQQRDFEKRWSNRFPVLKPTFF